ncbi:MAG TPA: hypothetical protein EYQ38_03500 [Candidatus Pelagibacter sp.]|jgi:tetratricopeptide (TPR) repeat protein|nr:hypothetical protein [Candidatus Pelagibacter sp.]
MQYLNKKIYFILFVITFLIVNTSTFSKNNENMYSQKYISNYLSGIISLKNNNNAAAFKYLKEVKSLKKNHNNFNIEFIQTLILLGKFKDAFEFSNDVWSEDRLLFEADLLLGLKYLINQKHSQAIKHFKRLDKTNRYNLPIESFLSNALSAWTYAAEGNEKDSFAAFSKISDRYRNLKLIQKSFLQCYFDFPDTKSTFDELIGDKDYNFTRYNFFLANYLLSKEKKEEAKKVIIVARNENNTNLLLKQSENFILTKNEKKIKSFFNCKKTQDNIAEIFYIIATLYSSEKEYKLSNFYLKISLFLNNNFSTNKTLLAENLFYQKKYKESKKIYKSIKLIGPNYSWHASKSLAMILSEEQGEKYSPSDLEKEFKLLLNPNFQDYYELANFYKNRNYFEESIKYYSLALKNIEKGHSLISKILHKRGTSYERIDDWTNAEKDLKDSLKILPDDPHVLNYLAYSWIEKKININEALEMLKEANSLKKNDGYIIDSLGWAYFARSNYIEAEKYLQKAVELMPLDPVINDHYADTLWMLKKNMQARYLWNHVLNLERTEKKLKDDIKKKLIYGVIKNS